MRMGSLATDPMRAHVFGCFSREKHPKTWARIGSVAKEPIRIVSYDPDGPAMFERPCRCCQLQRAVAAKQAGGTAMPGLVLLAILGIRLWSGWREGFPRPDPGELGLNPALQ